MVSDTYYVIAEVDKRSANESNSSVWPKLIAYSFDAKKILLEEGYGHGLMGGTLNLDGFDVSQWEDIFKETDSEWFKKYIVDFSLAKISSERDFIGLLKRNGCKVKTIKY
ncbi:MAG: hypothetical protein D9N13_23715 [Ketobacter sp. GenoA1]|nr:MAG: hypothetical protein D9N13_23715 [Ketobacter sp. GenoA1]RLT94239.1 MAG: hypothetical protein D9N15_17545 [Ketobacter sp.]